MAAARRDGAGWRTAGPRREHGAEREERVSQGLPLAPELGAGSTVTLLGTAPN